MSGDNRNYGTRVFVGNCKDGTSKEEVEVRSHTRLHCRPSARAQSGTIRCTAQAAFGRYGPLENVWGAHCGTRGSVCGDSLSHALLTR